MTEPTEPTPAEEHRDDNTTFPDADDSLDLPQNLDQARKLRSENKNLRERLHIAETEREAAITRLAAADRREVERHAATVLIDPSDIWQQADTSAFFDDEFKDIVGDKVVEAAKAVIAAKPHLAKPPTAPPPTDRPIEGLRGGAAPEAKPTTPSWATAIRGQGG